jgi:chromate transporter
LNLALLADLGAHCLMLSLLAIGGALGTAPDLQRFVVVDRGWISAADFTASLALAQASPGPNLLFIAVVGYRVAGFAGAAVSMFGMLLPSTLLTLAVFRWGSRRRDTLAVNAFLAGMAPITLGLLLSTGYVLALPVVHSAPGLLLLVASVALTWRTKVHPLWLICASALAGTLGWV